MGAWGEGMQASDSALDAIYIIERNYKHKIGSDAIEWYATRNKFSINNGDCRQEILGIADWILDKGISLKRVALFLGKVVKKELHKKCLDCWRDSEARKEALLRFQKRLRGEEVDEEELAKDNEGLLTKIDKFLGETENNGRT
jgi:hypothetical protein